ncbi:hypothetical protein [Curtobacterium sp. P97]|uniref:hypothetical protein n=1 Tax=Curtobacterium sp. P97 TaxID=2939562 RepID=UPI00203F9970|nr:hypothetical protein [Curtobacterium sp. P97]MCM3521976.1 hypothetical protein [Curtobacterium sp. P97]
MLAGVLQGVNALLAGLWGYALIHPWVWIFVLAMVTLKVFEVRVRRRPARRR